MAHTTRSLPDSDDKKDAAGADSGDMAMIVVTVVVAFEVFEYVANV